ncbi:TrkA-N domain family protein [Candidatus Magnetomorum sp. HK-1]|nr:TrkA-N domain family protein [Candidatus Magnetomorum sp. HK-1]
MKNVKAFGAIGVILIFFAFCLVVTLGTTGYLLVTPEDKSIPYRFWQCLYASFQMFIMEGGGPGNYSGQILTARFIAAALAGLGVLSLLYGYLSLSFRIIRILFYSNHYVICGLGEITSRFIEDLKEDKPKAKIVVIEMNPDSDYIASVKKKAIILYGNAMDERILRLAGIRKASYNFIATGSDDMNIRIANTISDLKQIRTRKTKLIGILHIAEWDNLNVLKDNLEFFHDSENRFFELIIYNMYQACAQIIFDKHGPHIDNKGINNKGFDESNVCIAILGFNKTTEAFLIENMILGQYHTDNRMKIYLIEKNIKNCMADFQYKFPFYSKYLEIIPVELENKELKFSSLENIATEIQKGYVFADHDAAVLEQAKILRQFFYNHSNMDLTVPPIVACLYEEADFVHLMDTNSKNSFEKEMKKKLGITLIYLLTDTCTNEKLIKSYQKTEFLAKMINYYYCDQDAINKLVKEKNFSTKAIQELHIDQEWKKLSDRLKDSNRYAARHIPVKNILVGEKNVDNPKKSKKLIPIEHNRWCAEKEVFGYSYGAWPENENSEKEKAAKDTAKKLLKIHPLIDTFDKLPQKEKDKDYDIFRITMILNNNFKRDQVYV